MNNDLSARTSVEMGAGFIIDHLELTANLGSYAKINSWPLSTRAEIAAIFVTLLTAPKDCTVELYTDSQCAIDTISRYCDCLSRK